MSTDEPPAENAPDPAKLVSDLSRGHIAARCLHVIADCGAADAVRPDGATPAAIAEHTGLTADALDRMLRLLAAHGVFAHGPGGTYRHTPASEPLRTDHPRSVRAYVRMAGMPAFWDRFTELSHTARTGRPRYDMAGLVEYYAAHPEESAIFNAAMVSKARVALPAVAAAYDFNAFRTIVDVGGGRGHLLQAILERAPACSRHSVRAPARDRGLGSRAPPDTRRAATFSPMRCRRRISICSWTCCTIGATPTRPESSRPCGVQRGRSRAS